MSHQNDKIDRTTDEDEDWVTEEVPFDNVPAQHAWKLREYGSSKKQEDGTWISGRKSGTLTIKNAEYGNSYLEAEIDGIPFFSIFADLDQWGTWYHMKLGDSKIRIFAQEWGTPSFLKTLGTALIQFSDENEARTGSYEREYVIPLDTDEEE